MSGNCILFADETDAAQLELEVGGGALVAYSCPAPDKTTDNEDGIAVIPCGKNSVVLAIADGAGGMPGGRRAARTAIAALESSVREHAGDDTGLRTVILNGIEAANLAVRELGTGGAGRRSARPHSGADSGAFADGICRRGRHAGPA
jgi:serine/threonine protein phosphatase PrpC